MASIIGSEVEIQEVEVEAVPVELPIETVETSDDTIEVQPMIALQPLPEAVHEEVVLQTREEVVGDLVSADSVPVPAPVIEITAEDVTSNKKGKGGKKKGKSPKYFSNPGLSQELSLDIPTSHKKWEQKQVQIKTLEGEFSVTMWATGRKSVIQIISRYIRKVLVVFQYVEQFDSSLRYSEKLSNLSSKQVVILRRSQECVTSASVLVTLISPYS